MSFSDLKQISPLTIKMVRGSELEPLFNGFIEGYHYLVVAEKWPFRFLKRNFWPVLRLGRSNPKPGLRPQTVGIPPFGDSPFAKTGAPKNFANRRSRVIFQCELFRLLPNCRSSSKVYRLCSRKTSGMSFLWISSLEGLLPWPIHRLETGSTRQKPPPHYQQYSLLNPTLG